MTHTISYILNHDDQSDWGKRGGEQIDQPPSKRQKADDTTNLEQLANQVAKIQDLERKIEEIKKDEKRQRNIQVSINRRFWGMMLSIYWRHRQLSIDIDQLVVQINRMQQIWQKTRP